MARELLLNPVHRRAGAIFAPWQDWIVPCRFSDADDEYRAVREHAGLIDYSAWGLLQVRGADRAGFLHNLLTNDLKHLAVGSGCEAGLLNPNAKLLADLLVLADAECHWIIVQRARAQIVLTTLERYCITEDVAFTNHTQTHVLLALQGPDSLAILNQALGRPLQFKRPLDHVTVTLSPDEPSATMLHVMSHSITGESGVVLAVSMEDAPSVWHHLMERGRPQGLRPVGWDALNVLRIEAGIPWYGLDMDETTLMPETGLEERAASDAKGCYVGQEIMARLQTYGSVSRKLMGLVCEGRQVPMTGDPITKDGERVGEITSGCFSPALQRPIAMGYVKRPSYEAGTQVSVMRAGQVIQAKLVKRPFVL